MENSINTQQLSLMSNGGGAGGKPQGGSKLHSLAQHSLSMSSDSITVEKPKISINLMDVSFLEQNLQSILEVSPFISLMYV